MKEKNKEFSAYFCPNCKSLDIKYVFELSNLFGIMPRRKCMDCNFEGLFPKIDNKGLIKSSMRSKK
jgi:hypothetical protein